MDNNDLVKQISKKATETIEQAKSSIPAPHTDSVPAAKDDIVLGDESGTSADSETAQNFERLPIEDLICAPIIAATKGQQELTSVYIDTLMHLAYSDEVDKKTNEKETKEKFTLEATQNQTKPEVDSQVSYGSCFRLNTNITGSVSSDSLHKRQTDNSATYNIRARADQQPPSEDIAKLTELFSQMTESVPKKELPE